MATQAKALSAPLTRNNNQPSPGIIGQVITLITRPAAFFHRMPQTRQWIWAAVLILVIFGFAASNQTQSETTASTTQNAQGFDMSVFQLDPTADTAAAAMSASAPTQTTDTSDTNTTLMSALLAACGVLVMWAGQTVLLSLVPMLNSHPPNVARCLQIAIWASLPLALMLGLRQLYFSTGGTGGSTGLSLLLDRWDTYATLPEAVQRMLAVFMSNITLFWLWSMVLLYFGARYALDGRRWSTMLVLLMWITAYTIIPALVSEPVTTIAPRTTTTVEQTDTSPSNNTTTQTGTTDMFSGGMPSGGMPSGGMPSGGGFPGG